MRNAYTSPCNRVVFNLNFQNLKSQLYSGILFFVFNVLLLSFGSELAAQNCTVNAGIAREYCATDPVQLFGQTQGLAVPGSQTWTQVSGPSVLIMNPNTLSPMVIGVIGGNDYTFRISEECTDGSLVFDEVTYTVLETPTATASGGSPGACPGDSPTLSGNATGSNETGLWEGGGSGVVLSDVNDPNPIVTLNEGAGGTATFVWTVTNDMTGCSASSQGIDITNCGGEEPVSAGPDQLLSDCFLLTTSTTLEGTAAGLASCGQMAEWSVVSGPNVPNIQSPNNPNTTVSNLIEGTYVFRYEVDGPCASGSDLVEVEVPRPVGPSTEASAAVPAGTSYCIGGVDTIVLEGNAPIYVNETVTWMQVSGPAVTLVDPNSQVAKVADLVMGSYEFSYTIENTVTGCSSTDNVSFSIGGDPVVSLDPGPIAMPCGATTVDLNYSDGGLGSTTWRFVSRPFGSNPTPYSAVNTTSPFTVGGFLKGVLMSLSFGDLQLPVMDVQSLQTKSPWWLLEKPLWRMPELINCWPVMFLNEFSWK